MMDIPLLSGPIPTKKRRNWCKTLLCFPVLALGTSPALHLFFDGCNPDVASPIGCPLWDRIVVSNPSHSSLVRLPHDYTCLLNLTSNASCTVLFSEVEPLPNNTQCVLVTPGMVEAW